MSECEANWSGMLRHAIFEVRGTAAFHAFALNYDFELVGAQRVPGSERCAGVVAVAAPNVVEQDSLFFVAYGVPSRLGLRRGAVPVAFRDGVGGFGLALFNGAGGRLGGVRRAQGTRRGRRARTRCATRGTPNWFPGSGLRCAVHTARPGRSSC